MTQIILATTSPIRRQILTEAGIEYRTATPEIDEPAITGTLTAEDNKISADEIAAVLAQAKALEVSARHAQAVVVGADQVLTQGVRRFSKPVDIAQARDHLKALRGRTHTLVSAVCCARDGKIRWQHVSEARLRMREFSDDFLEAYLSKSGTGVCESVGAYKLEGLGAQFFEDIEGDYFTILGLPLLPLLKFLREQDVITT